MDDVMMIALGITTLLLNQIPGSQPKVPIVQIENGFIRTVFYSKDRSITVILPDHLCPGDHISGTAFASEKDFKMETLQVDIGDAHGMVPSPGSSRRSWTLPDTKEPRLSMTAWTTDGISWGTTYVPLSASGDKPTGFLVPSFARIGAPFVIKGPFNGDISDTSLKNGDLEVPIVAESPRSAVGLVPSLSLPGETTLDLSEGDRHGSATTRFLLVTLTADKTSLNKGDQTTLSMQVQGIQGLTREKSPMIVVENLTPKIVDLDGHAKHFIIAQPSKDGDFAYQFRVTSLLGGRFSVTATVDPGPGVPLKLENSSERTRWRSRL